MYPVPGHATAVPCRSGTRQQSNARRFFRPRELSRRDCVQWLNAVRLESNWVRIASAPKRESGLSLVTDPSYLTKAANPRLLVSCLPPDLL